MSSIFKFFIILGIIIAVASLLGALIPQQLNADMNGAIIYFLSALAPLNFLIPMDTAFQCIQILFNFIYFVCLFYFIYWLINLTTS